MASTGKLRLSLTDVRNRRITEEVDVILRHRTLAEVTRARVKPGPATIITGLHGRPEGVYQIQIDPPSYQFVSQFVEVLSSKVTPLEIVCAVDPKKVRALDVPKFASLTDDARRMLEASDGVLGFAGLTGPGLLKKLDPIRQAGFLNIIAKSAQTVFSTGHSVASHFLKLLELRGDRFFVAVPRELREETKHSVQEGLFEPVSALLHRIPDGFTEAGSFKTQDRYGNLQLTFCVRGDEWRADVDIDDANGIEHVFQVTRNALSGAPTHPYNIQQLLLQHQKLDPGYDLLL